MPRSVFIASALPLPCIVSALTLSVRLHRLLWEEEEKGRKRKKGLCLVGGEGESKSFLPPLFYRAPQGGRQGKNERERKKELLG